MDYPKRDVEVEGALANAFFRADKMTLLDPDDPTVDANELYRSRGNKMLDARNVNWNCPLCHKTMAFELFAAHARPCAKQWFKTVDATKRRFTGADIPQQSTAIGGVAAAADSGAKPLDGAE